MKIDLRKTISILFILILHLSFLSGQNPDPSTINDFQSTPVALWKFRSSQPFMGSPVIDKEMVYQGGVDSTLYALDITNGNVKWKLKTKGPIRSAVCLNNNTLYLISGDGNLYAIDKLTGKIIWTFKTNGEKQYDIYDYFQSSPVFYNNSIYFGSGDGNIYAVKASNGEMIWSYATGNVVHSTPAISDNKLFAGSMDGYVYALNIDNGQMIWKFKSVGHNYFPKGEMQFSPATSNGMVYIGGRDYNIYALDANKGYCHWNREFPRGWVPAIIPSYKNDSVIYVSTSDPLVLIAMNAVTEEVLWETKMKSEQFGRLTLSKGMGYAGTLQGQFYGVDLKTGKIQWTFTTDGYKENHLKYFKPDDTFRDDILSILKTNEEFLAALFRMGAIYSTAAISENAIVVSSGEGILYCLRRS